MPRAKKEKLEVAVIDLETDPFKFGRFPKPFSAAFFDGQIYQYFWGIDCVPQLMQFISKLQKKYIIYGHNGGKFDFFYMFDYLDNPIKIINGRIVEAAFCGHKFRDSYAILPMPLSAYKKDDIDYKKFEKRNREKNKEEILRYLKTDCEYLFTLVSAFNTRFGEKLTIGATALGKLRELHEFDNTNLRHDEKFRPFYFGGRVEAFKTGIINGDYKIYDVNSMYPHVMHDYNHPTGIEYAEVHNPQISATGDLIGFGKRFYFITFIGKNKGALPVRTKTGLDFNVPHGEFTTTAHEMRVALKYGLVEIESVINVRVPHYEIRFDKYVDIYAAEKVAAKKSGDKVSEIFSKFLLNSAYGKFGQNGALFFDYQIVRHIGELESDEWELYEKHDAFMIFRKPATNIVYYDVSTAASITSAARSILLEAIMTSEDVLYCDTDSILCKNFPGEKDNSKLGAWKFEGDFDSVAIAGKKMYAAFKNKVCIKLATKGVRLTAAEIIKLCKGKVINWKNAAPTFSAGKNTVKFVDRNIKMN
jgi:DNA polymerase elongation subunit (family B)